LQRRWWILKWAGLVLSLLIVVAWAVSLQWSVFHIERYLWRSPARQDLSPVYTEQDQGAMYEDFSRGCIEYYHGFYRPVEPGTGWYYWRCSTSPVWTPGARGLPDGSLWVRVPLWMPFLIVALPTAFLWRRGRRRIPPGHCRKCGYNLTGNVSGVCPECGVMVPLETEGDGREQRG